MLCDIVQPTSSKCMPYILSLNMVYTKSHRCIQSAAYLLCRSSSRGVM
jgi:hypothetical protein